MRIFDVKINQTHQEINKRRNCKKKEKKNIIIVVNSVEFCQGFPHKERLYHRGLKDNMRPHNCELVR